MRKRRYKLGGLSVCAAALALSVLASLPLHGSGVRARYHQHLEESHYTPCGDHGDERFCSHLPLILIDTGGVEIPGREETDPSGQKYCTLAEDGSDRIAANIKAIRNTGSNNHPDDDPAHSSPIIIHVRGNTSRAFDKSGYSFRLVDEDGGNNPLPLLGMDAHHEWALHGPFMDKTLMRNYMWYNIGGEIMEYAPNVRFCELILNGQYQGLYVLTEKITAGNNGARLNLTVNAKNGTFSGYLLQLNGGRPPSNELLADQFTYYALRTRYQLNIEFPGAQNLTPEMDTAIAKDFSAFEKALYSYDYDSGEYGYRRLIDTESFIDYFLINELTCNYDAGWLSTFIYKGLDGRYRMVLWDMNSCCDNYADSQTEPMAFQMQNCLWFSMLFKDEDFTGQLIRRYRELRKTVFDPDYLCGYIDDVAGYLGPAAERNFRVWGYTFEQSEDMLNPTERNPRSYQQAVEQMKDFIIRRVAWMDERCV